MPIFAVQDFGFRLGSTRRLLQRVLAVLCLAAFGCGCGKVASTRMSLSLRPLRRNCCQTKPWRLWLGSISSSCTTSAPRNALHSQTLATIAATRSHEQSFTIGGKPGTVYDVTLRISGIFEPTTITGGDTPDPEHPYFKVGGTVSTPDWSQWRIEVSEPEQTYWPLLLASVNESSKAGLPVKGDTSVVDSAEAGSQRTTLQFRRRARRWLPNRASEGSKVSCTLVGFYPSPHTSQRTRRLS